MSVRKTAYIYLVMLTVLFLCGCSKKINKDEYARELKVEEVNVVIPGVERDYTFMFVSDLHIVDGTDNFTDSNQYYAEKASEIIARRNSFQNAQGMLSAEQWELMPGVLDDFNADGILFGADMIDFYSDSNIEELKAGLDSLKTPYMYVRADHDYGNWNGPISMEHILAKNREIDGDKGVSLWEYPAFVVMGINNTTSSVTDEMMVDIRNIFALNKPIIILMHVPLDSTIDPTLESESKAHWSDRNLTWGIGCFYAPDDNMQELLGMIYAKDTPVVEVLAGHLHFSWDGFITQKVHEHIFSAAYENYIGKITVTAE